MFHFKDTVFSHIKPYEYREDNKHLGNYIVSAFDVQFIPTQSLHVRDVVRAGITLSTKYKSSAWIKFNGVTITIPYQTNLTSASIDNLVNQYRQMSVHKNKTCNDYYTR